MIIITPDKTKKIYTLNALRGFSAIFVVFYHMVGAGKYLDPNYLPASFKHFYDQSHFRVLIFFVISGVVISLSNKKRLTLKTIPTYVKKRALRIYPIYIVSLIFALAVAQSVYSFYTIAGNFTFLQVLFTNVIFENSPIWTLHYEIIFYILFIPLSMLKIDPVKVIALSIFIGISNYFLYPYLHTPIITSYCFGFAFWSLGLVIVKYFTKKNTTEINYIMLVSFLFLILTIPYLNQMEIASNNYATHYFGHTMVFPEASDENGWFKVAFQFTDLTYLPYCFMAIILFSGRDFKYKKMLLLLLQLVPAYALYSMFRESGHINLRKMIFPICCYTVSCLLALIHAPSVKRLSKKIINFLIWMGGISYGTYIIHLPMLILFHRIPVFTGSAFTFSVRMILYFLCTFFAAYLLEYNYQNWILNLLQHRKIIVLKHSIKSALAKPAILNRQ